MPQARYRDLERTLADYEWEAGESPPSRGSPGLQPRTSRGIERDPVTFEIKEYLYIGPGWQLLREPDEDTKRIADLEARMGIVEGRVTDLESQ